MLANFEYKNLISNFAFQKVKNIFFFKNKYYLIKI